MPSWRGALLKHRDTFTFLPFYLLQYKTAEIICCSIYKEWKAIEYLHGIGNNTIHKETNISEDQWSDGRKNLIAGVDPWDPNRVVDDPRSVVIFFKMYVAQGHCPFYKQQQTMGGKVTQRGLNDVTVKATVQERTATERLFTSVSLNHLLSLYELWLILESKSFMENW
jgi:hypothetical protein